MIGAAAGAGSPIEGGCGWTGSAPASARRSTASSASAARTGGITTAATSISRSCGGWRGRCRCCSSTRSRVRMPSVTGDKMFVERIQRKLKSLARGVVNVENQFWVFSPMSVPGAAGQKLTGWALAPQIKLAAQRAGIRRPVLWVHCPAGADAGRRDRRGGGGDAAHRPLRGVSRGRPRGAGPPDRRVERGRRTSWSMPRRI